MPTLIRIELYGEYVKARNEISQERLLQWIDSEKDDIQFPELTPKHPRLHGFTPGEIFAFEDLFRNGMMAVHFNSHKLF